MERSIIHLNVADFAVAVERGIDRRLEGRPVIIAPAGAARAVVYDMSEEAFRAGVRKGLALGRALRLCRDACVLTPRPERYEQAMRALLERALPCSPRVEAGEHDGHLFIDATGTARLLGPAVDLAWRLQRRVRAELGLSPIWSVAPNKLVAKVATRLVKPEGEYIVAAGEEEPFLAPLPLELVPGIEAEELGRLREFNLRRAGDVAALTVKELQVPFGKRARFLHETVRGIDPSPVQPVGERPPRVAAEHMFAEDTHEPAAIGAALYGLAEHAGAALRSGRRAAGRLTLVVDYADGLHRTRQAALRPATANDISLFEAAGRALQTAGARRVRIRRLGLTCDRLVFPPAQLSLFAEEQQPAEKRDRIVSTLDAVRRRFGREAVQVGRTLAAFDAS